MENHKQEASKGSEVSTSYQQTQPRRQFSFQFNDRRQLDSTSIFDQQQASQASKKTRQLTMTSLEE